MKIAEIDRDLRDVDPKIRYWFKYQQEQLIATQHQLDQCADILLKFFMVLENLQLVNEELRSNVERTMRKRDGMVDSVLIHPDDEDG